MLAYKIIERLYINDYDISYSLKEYRKRYLSNKVCKNIIFKAPKHTPIIIEKIINCFERKIKNKTLLKDVFLEDYKVGINEIWKQYHDFYCKHQRKSKKEKRIDMLASEYILKNRLKLY
jgi:hypothetical protein